MFPEATLPDDVDTPGPPPSTPLPHTIPRLLASRMLRLTELESASGDRYTPAPVLS